MNHRYMCRTSQHRVQELSVRNLLVMPMFPDCAWTNPRQILAHRVLRRGTTHLGLMTTRISTNLRYPARHHLIMTVSLSAAVRHPVHGQGCFLPTRVSRPMLGQGSFLQDRVSRPTRALATFLLYRRKTLTAGLTGPNGAQLSVPERPRYKMPWRS